jgi:hypothetical protein
MVIDWKIHDGLCVFSVRAAARHFISQGRLPSSRLSIGGIGLAPQAGAWFGLQVSMALPNFERARLRRTIDAQSG